MDELLMATTDAVVATALATRPSRPTDAKTWWRNFVAEGGPISLHLDGIDRTGHAVARRDEQCHITVTVRLNG